MISTVLLQIRNRRQHDENDSVAVDHGTNPDFIHWPATQATPASVAHHNRHHQQQQQQTSSRTGRVEGGGGHTTSRSRRSGSLSAGPSFGRSNFGGGSTTNSSGYDEEEATSSTSAPSRITIVPRTTTTINPTGAAAVSSGSRRSGSSRNNPIGAASREWANERDDVSKPNSSSRARRLYPPPPSRPLQDPATISQEAAVAGWSSSSPSLAGRDWRNEPEYVVGTSTDLERPPLRSPKQRPAHFISSEFGPPPEVVRLDGSYTRLTGHGGGDLGVEEEREAFDPPPSYSYSYAYPHVGDEFDTAYVPNNPSTRMITGETPSVASSQPNRSRPPRQQPRSHSQPRTVSPHSLGTTRQTRSNPGFGGGGGGGGGGGVMGMSGHEYFPFQTRSDGNTTQSHSEADFYATALEDSEAETEASTSDYYSDNILDSFPLPARSMTSTTSSRSGSGISSAAAAVSNSGGGGGGAVLPSVSGHPSVKRSGLKLQVNPARGAIAGSGYAMSMQHAGNAGKAGGSSGQRQQQVSGPIAVPMEYPSTTMPTTGGDVDASDVYKHPTAYGYPMIHPLSPIAEQDYISPSPHSSRDDERSTKLGRSGSVLNSISGREPREGGGDDKGSMRTGSLGSATGDGGHKLSVISGSLGSQSLPDVHRPSPFITRQLNRTTSQTSSKSWTESVTGQHTPATPTPSSTQASPRVEGIVPCHAQNRSITTHLPAMRVSRGGEGIHTTPSSAVQQNHPTSPPPAEIQLPPGAIVNTTPAVPTVHGIVNGTPLGGGGGGEGRTTTIPKLPSIPDIGDLRFSMLESVSPKNSRGVDRMPVIQGSIDGHRAEDDDDDDDDDDDGDIYGEEEDEEYERHSLHADSFVTAGEAEGGGIELETMVEEGGEESFIHRRWERDADLGTGEPISSTADYPTFRAKSRSGPTTPMFTPAFWTFWMGFFFPVLWLIGGWHFTHAGEMPPKYTVWEWFFWNRRWRPKRWLMMAKSGWCCNRPRRTGRRGKRRGVRRSNSDTDTTTLNIQQRAGKVYPALPRWVAEKQSTDNGRMRLNDPKRSLKGIQFGYPFVPRSGSASLSSPSRESPFVRFATAPNRVLDQLYGVRLRELRGRPETGRRMFDPWVQRCRYAFCYALVLLAAGLLAASTYLIVVNTRNLHK